MRVLITGMGGELGTRLAIELGTDHRVEAIMGLDIDPPRRRHPGEFHRVDPRNRDRTTALIRSFRPTALVHLGVYEPFARSSPRSAAERTAAGTVAAVTAAVDAGGLDRIVVRSGIEVYGRRRGSVVRPDERVRPDPTSPFGRELLHVERACIEAGLHAAAPVTCLRFAPWSVPTSRAPWAATCAPRPCPSRRWPIRPSRSCTSRTRRPPCWPRCGPRWTVRSTWSAPGR